MTTRSLQTATMTSPAPRTGILHPFPTREIPHLDPFVFLDTGAPRQLGKGEIYVGPHPHRGVQPVSLLFRGRIEHRDSLGTHRTVTSGGIQWLVAGSGALHEEVLCGDEEGVFHMAQLWVNVPAARKMDAPEHHAVPAERVPTLETLGAGSKLRLYAGSLAGREGPAPMPTPVLVGHGVLEAGGTISVPVPRGWTAALTVVDGEVSVGDRTLGTGGTAVFADDGETVEFSSVGGGQVLLMCGEPIGEAIAMGGGFVMNDRAEVERAFADYRNGGMGELVASR